MNDTEDTAQSGDWTVEPPRKTGRGRKALRIALIVAAVGAAAAGAAVGVTVLFGEQIKEGFESKMTGLFGGSIHEEPVKEAGVLIAEPLSDNYGQSRLSGEESAK